MLTLHQLPFGVGNRPAVADHIPPLALLLLSVASLPADNFTRADLDRWQNKYKTSVETGEKLFPGGLSSKNTVSCDQCHPNASNVHPETFPRFQQQLGKIADLGEMINWCIMNPLESDPIALDDADMVALQANILQERRGVALAPGKH